MLPNNRLFKLDNIKENHSTNVEACCTDMFKYWLEVDDKASWNKLIEALKRMDKNHLAECIFRDISQGT